MSAVDDDIAEAMDDRKEHQLEGSIKFSTYAKFFKAVHSNIFIIVVVLLFLASQVTWTGADFFLAEWLALRSFICSTISIVFFGVDF